MADEYAEENAPGGDGGQCVSVERERDALLFMLEDLERSQRQIRQAHEEWIAALDAIHDPVFMHDREYRIMRSNRAYAERAGMSVKEVLGKPYWEVFPKGDGPLPHCHKVLDGAVASANGTGAEEVDEVRLDSGEIFMSRSFVVRDERGSYLYSLHIMEDVTERTMDEARLQQSEQRFRNLVETSSDWIWEVDDQAVYTYVSPKVRDLLGYEPEEVVGRTPFDFMPGEEAERVRKLYFDITAERRSFAALENINRHKDGDFVVLETNGVPMFDGDGKFRGYRGVDRDITGRKRSEQSLMKLNRTLQTLTHCNQALIHATDEEQLLGDMCRVIVETGRYHAAWVGYAEHDAEKSIRLMAQCGFAEGYLESLQFSWRDDERGLMPTARAIRSGEAQISHRVGRDPNFAAWREQARQAGIASCMALPLKNEAGAVFGNLSIYADQEESFDQAEMELLQEMSEDLAFGIQTLRVREAQKRSAEQLVEGLEETVQVIATMVEMRDPYTNGHQQRVAELAVAIATEMALPEEQIRGIHLAGEIHDLGKIQVPAEILSKPGRLSEAEFALIKSHPQTGYDVLKNIKFPWPIAQIVLQHHERLDGSGYPQGLIGDQIMPEARILIVADVVEAMSSHRPYRPGLGLPSALAEIRKNRGRFYDPQVVDACIRLFEEKRYQPPQAWATEH